MYYIRTLIGTTWHYVCNQSGRAFLYAACPFEQIACSWETMDEAEEDLEKLKQTFPDNKLEILSDAPAKIS